MSKKIKIWLVIATLLVLIGCIIFAGVMTVFNWDFTKLSTVEYETNDYTISEKFKNISVDTDTADIVFIPTENEEVKVVCYEQTKVKHLATVIDDTLQINVVDTRKWYDYIGVFFGTPKITVYTPKGDYGALTINSSTGDVEIPKEYNFESIDVTQSTGDIKVYSAQSGKIKVETSTGDICAENLTAIEIDLTVSTGKVSVSDVNCEGDVKINVSTGKTMLNDVKCKNIISNGDTGDMLLKNTVSSESIFIKRSTGDVRLEGCDANELTIETDTGSVTGSLLTDKVFITKSDTGRIDVPSTTSGGKCKITTNTGNIKIKYEIE